MRGSDATHALTTDPDARLYRTSPGTGAMLCMGHAPMENRSGLIVQGVLTQAGGHAQRRAALDVFHRHSPGSTRRLTLGADKSFDAAEVVTVLRQACITPHVAQKPRSSAIDGRTTRHQGTPCRSGTANGSTRPSAGPRPSAVWLTPSIVARADALPIHPRHGRQHPRPAAPGQCRHEAEKRPQTHMPGLHHSACRAETPLLSDRRQNNPAPGYALSIRHRKRIDEAFGWAKTVGGMAHTVYRGASGCAPHSSSPWPPTPSPGCPRPMPARGGEAASDTHADFPEAPGAKPGRRCRRETLPRRQLLQQPLSANHFPRSAHEKILAAGARLKLDHLMSSQDQASSAFIRSGNLRMSGCEEFIDGSGRDLFR
jgi:hypothetical protein